LVGAFGLAGSASAGTYSGGTGEPNDPYRIATANDLNDIGNHVEDFNKCFVMVNDINLADYNGTQFNIIGPNSTTPFTGVFDGNGHAISNFTYSSSGTDYVGIFGYVGNNIKVIKDLTLIDPNVDAGTGNEVGALAGRLYFGSISGCCVKGGGVSGNYDVGGLVGQNRGGIEDCNVAVTVSGEMSVGGLAGSNDNIAGISNCHAAGTVIGSRFVGGLVGSNKGRIYKCYAMSDVNGNDITGGLAGHSANLFGSDGQTLIDNSYACGTVLGGDGVGGLVGVNLSSNFPAIISNCYSSGNIIADSNVGGLVGFCYQGSYTKSFWDSDVNPDVNGIGNGSDPNVIGKPTAEMQTEATFTDAGWDFVEVWDIGEGQTYPFLRVYPAGDLNHDGLVNMLDFAIVALDWLEGTEE
jgi:hypothetical protein